MDRMDSLDSLLSASGVLTALFDDVRIVEAGTGKVLALREGKLVETGVNCSHYPCPECLQNPAAPIAQHTCGDVLRLAYRDSIVLLTLSVPLVVDQREVVIELVKDVTHATRVELEEHAHAQEVPAIIQKLNHMATTDGLTGLMNRRFMDEKLPVLLKSSHATGRPMSIAILDIDYFKQINDAHFHQCGDKVLAELASILNTFIRRESDFAARYGGEEFLLCFPGTPLGTCREICERIRRQVEAHVFDLGGNALRITVSMGVAESGEVVPLTQEGLIALADKRLYEAKARGRNQVI